jgi:hypothetical protein
LQLPDDTITALYPLGDNYIIDTATNQRSPKTLQALCVDTICRSLPLLNGELPPGLPADVVNDIVASLQAHRALNATTLRILKNCEFQELTLAHSRGVTDDWLRPLTTTNSDHDDDHGTASMDIMEEKTETTGTTMATSVTTLDLRGSTSLSDRGLVQLGHMEALQICRLDGCHSILGRGLCVLEKSYLLHTLSLANCRRLQDEAVINISHLVALEHLTLDGCRCLTNRSLEALANLYNMRKLDLSQCDLITDEGLEYLQDLEMLEELSLGWCRLITDEGLNQLTQQPGRAEFLKILRLARCPITDDGVAFLGRLRRLEELDLNGCASLASGALGEVLGFLEHLHTLDVSYVPGIL